jgi:anhydro-N-acetylmuramic acid kinase
MPAHTLGKVKKIKKRRILVISASSIQSGVQCIYIEVDKTWEIISKTIIPYPPKIALLLDRIFNDPENSVKIAEVAFLDAKLSQFFIECARLSLTQVSRFQKKPTLIVLNKPGLWNGIIEETPTPQNWSISLGDAQYISNILNIPVVSDFIKKDLIDSGMGQLPTYNGNCMIASKCTGINIFINIGIVARMTIIDSNASKIIIDSDTGPGTVLIDKTARAVSPDSSIDRDGHIAANGKVDGDCLEQLVTTDWFLEPTPKVANVIFFDMLLSHERLNQIDKLDRLATITALTARSIYNTFRSAYKNGNLVEGVYISGGGANNLTLMEYLATYFQPIPIFTTEKIGIPVEMKTPLALGLTVNANLNNETVINSNSGNSPHPKNIGRWYFPES